MRASAFSRNTSLSSCALSAAFYALGSLVRPVSVGVDRRSLSIAASTKKPPKRSQTQGFSPRFNIATTRSRSSTIKGSVGLRRQSEQLCLSLLLVDPRSHAQTHSHRRSLPEGGVVGSAWIFWRSFTRGEANLFTGSDGFLRIGLRRQSSASFDFSVDHSQQSLSVAGVGSGFTLIE